MGARSLLYHCIFYRLSGLSPFMGDTDSQTYNNISKAEFDFDDESFEGISDEAKDFISKLLIKESKYVQQKYCPLLGF